MSNPIQNSRMIQSNRVVPEQKKISELTRIKMLLDYLGIINKHILPDQENKLEQVFIEFLNEGQQASGILLNLAFINDIDNTNELDEESKTHNLQFLTTLGEAKIDENNILELMNLIVRFNNFLPIGQFGLNIENTVYFRYNLPSKERITNNILLVEVIEMIEFYLRTLGQNIADFVDNKKSHNQALEDGLNSLVNPVIKD